MPGHSSKFKIKEDMIQEGDILMATTMHNATILVGFLFLASTELSASVRKLDTIDTAKIKKDSSTLFVQHLLSWPDKSLIEHKGIPNIRIPEDIVRLKMLLRTLLRPEYRPTEKTIDVNSIAIEECNGPP